MQAEALAPQPAYYRCDVVMFYNKVRGVKLALYTTVRLDFVTASLNKP